LPSGLLKFQRTFLKDPLRSSVNNVLEHPGAKPNILAITEMVPDLIGAQEIRPQRNFCTTEVIQIEFKEILLSVL
jgi:hypothetical protein